MSNSKDINNEDLKKLEDEAYFELCQIIAEAMQLQDIELLDARIATWKNKYKKLLDRPSTSSKSDFKKRVEFLLTQYYSQVTQYILNRLKLREQKKIENQAKALTELYRIIKDTNDLDLLKNKVKKWEEKYPVSGFLKMYQKRIEFYTREKNLKENAFEQEKAFKNLVDITKKTATFDELQKEISDWEKEYSINDKYTIDDFIKHQSEVKRFTSDEFLKSIARDEPELDNFDKPEDNSTFSNLASQDSAYKTLASIAKNRNNIDEVFNWVYKNKYIKFNDKYKELILGLTYLDYSPKYLNKLPKPEMNMSKSSLPFGEYKNIDEIKRYAVISYFNLLLPPERAIPNEYFKENIEIIYYKSEKAKVSNEVTEDTTLISEFLDSGIEIPFENPNKDMTTPPPEEDIVIADNEINLPLEELEEKTYEQEKESTVITTSDKEPEIEPLHEKNESINKPLDYDIVIDLSPQFFVKIHNFVELVHHVDSDTTQFIQEGRKQEEQNLELDTLDKTKVSLE